jgi:putative phosphonate transport system ATP-binding protein
MKPLLSVNNLTHLYAPGKGFSDVSFELWPGEVLGSSASPAPVKPPC